MGHEISRSDGSAVVRFTADSGMVDSLFAKVRTKINRELKIPGFRQAIPKSMIDGRFGNLVRAEVADDLREALVASLLDEQDWVLSGRDAAGSDALPVEHEDYVFEQTFTLFELDAPAGYDSLDLELPVFDSGEAVDRTLDALRWKLVDYRKVERPSQDLDLVLVDAGRPAEGREPEKMALRIGRADLGAGLDALLTGRSPGDSFTARIEFDPGVEGAENGRPTRFEVAEVREPVLPELDDELAKKAGGFQTLEEFRASIRERAEARWRIDRQEMLESQALEKILSGMTFEPPAYMVENLTEDLARNLEGGRDEETDKALREIAARKVREFLVLRAIGIRESIGPTEEEIAKETAGTGSRSSAVDRIRNRRTMEFILSKAGIRDAAPAPQPAGGEGQGQGWSWKECEPPAPAD